MFMQGDQQVTGFKLSPLVGPYAKSYMFLIGSPGSDCPKQIASVGSYSYMIDQAEPGRRLYHFDIYEPNVM